MSFFSIAAAAAAAPVKVAVLPFVINSDKDFNFLRQGIVQMLASRLSAPGKVEVIDPALALQAGQAHAGQSGESLARQAGAELKADYAVHGAVTILGDSVSIDAVAVDLNGSRPPLTFFKQTPNLGGVIPQIDRLAEEINTQLLGIAPSRPAAEALPAAPPPRPQPAPAPAPVQPELYEHPDKLIPGARGAGDAAARIPASGKAAAAEGPRSPLNPAFQTAERGETRESATFWKSKNYPFMINGVDVGDVDGDGKLETVVAAPDKIYIYRFDQGRHQTVTEIESGFGVRNIGVSVGDINGNGRSEIFVTALSQTLNQANSYVLEFDGREFKRIVQKSRFYYSIVHHPKQGILLLGQRQASAASSPFDEPVFQMGWKGADYEPEKKLLPGGKANVLGLAYGDILNDGSDSFIALAPYDHLQVLLPSGKSEWKEGDAHGGTTLYFAMPPEDAEADFEPFYLPVRLRWVDLNKDGKGELLTFLNEGLTGRLLKTQRYFKRSAIEALSWEGVGLVSQWKTRPLPGRIQDIVVADFDNDGVDEVLAAVVSKEGAIIFTDAQSSLVAYKLNQPGATGK